MNPFDTLASPPAVGAPDPAVDPLGWLGDFAQRGAELSRPAIQQAAPYTAPVVQEVARQASPVVEESAATGVRKGILGALPFPLVMVGVAAGGVVIVGAIKALARR